MEGLTVLITGGGSGIGFGTARAFLDRGANVAICGRTHSRLEEAAAALNGGEKLRYFTGDVSSEGHAKSIVSNTVKAFGALNILINNAGVFHGRELIQMEEDEFDDNINVNLKGTWLMCRYAARPLIEVGGGAIVNVSSYLALRAHPSTPSSAYAAAKGGVLSLTRSLAVELAQYKIRVNAVLPAVVDTPMLGSFMGADYVPQLLEKSKKAHPIGRAGTPEDVAKAIVFLADPANGWLTGVEMPIDGGRSVL